MFHPPTAMRDPSRHTAEQFLRGVDGRVFQSDLLLATEGEAGEVVFGQERKGRL